MAHTQGKTYLTHQGFSKLSAQQLALASFLELRYVARIPTRNMLYEYYTFSIGNPISEFKKIQLHCTVEYCAVPYVVVPPSFTTSLPPSFSQYSPRYEYHTIQCYNIMQGYTLPLLPAFPPLHLPIPSPEIGG